MEGNPPGTIDAAFVLWATRLDKSRVHSDQFATGTVRRVVVLQRNGWPTAGPAPMQAINIAVHVYLVQFEICD